MIGYDDKKPLVDHYYNMISSLYNVVVDSMSLLSTNDISIYMEPKGINAMGDVFKPEEDNVHTSITIVEMININKKGYPIMICNREMIGEIITTIYGHITNCLILKRMDIAERYPVPESDLLDMELFMLDIIRVNHVVVQESNLVKEQVQGMATRSRYGNYGGAKAGEVDVSSFRRITSGNVDIDINDILNSI